jgi:hypothetical protein
MRKCCCCGVKTASVILGTYNLFLSLLVIIPLASFLAESEVPNLNPIQDNQKYIENVLEDILREHSWTMQSYQDIMRSAREWWPTMVLIALSLAAVSATSARRLILGVRCQVRSLMVPYLVLTMLDIILAGAGGIVIVVALFYANIIPGVVSALVYVILAVLSLYSWTAVLAAYQILGETDYGYAPAPSKPGPGDYYPSAPQHFDMEDYRDSNAKRNRFP